MKINKTNMSQQTRKEIKMSLSPTTNFEGRQVRNDGKANVKNC
jgi:hypothetical protein